MKKSFFLHALLIVVLSILAGLYAVLIFSKAYLFALIMGILLIIIGFYPIIKGIKEKKFDLFEPIYLFVAYFMLAMGIRGFYDLGGGSDLLNSLYDITSNHFITLIGLVFLYSVIGLLFLYIGYYSKLGTAIANSIPKLPALSWSHSRVLFVVLLFLIIGILGAGFWANAFGGISTVIKAPWKMANIESMGHSGISALLNFAIIGFFILYLYRIKKEKSLLEKAFLFFLGLIIILGLFFITSSKIKIFGFLLTLLIFHHYFKKPLNLKVITIFLLIIVIFSSSIWAYRYTGLNLNLLWQKFVFNMSHPFELVKPFLARSYSADSFAIILDKTPSVYDFQIGQSFKESLYWYIPRAWWPEKPLGYSATFGKTYMAGTGYAGSVFVTPSMMGELYLNFSWVGIIIGFFLMGIILKTTYVYLVKKNNKNRIFVLLYAVCLIRLLLFVDGPIIDHIASLLMNLSPILLAILFLSKWRRPKLSNYAHSN